jgi:4-amino-4-deoxy-L-arabinose transferase-like glycosyltransferase
VTLLNPISQRRKIILIFLVAFAFRLFLIKFIPYPFFPERIDDAHSYDIMGLNILQGNGFSGDENPPYKPTIRRTPVYPIFLAGIYAIFGQAYDIVRIIQAFIDSITCFLVYLISLFCFRNKKNYKQLALLTFILAALCPFTAFFASMIYADLLTTFLFTLSVFLFILAISKKQWQYYFLSGITIGLAFLCRPAIFAYLFILVVCMFLSNIRNNIKLILKYIFIYMFGVSLVWLPWVYRNYVVFDRFVPLALNSGEILWVGTFPPGRYEKDFTVDRDIHEAYLKLKGKAALDMDSWLGKEAIKRIKKEPLKYFYYSFKRIGYLWVSSNSMFIQIEKTFTELIAELKAKKFNSLGAARIITMILIKGLLLVTNLMLVSTGVFGMIIAARFWRIIYPVILAPIYITLVHAMLGAAGSRYIVSAWPIFIIFSAYALLFAKKMYEIP